MRCDQCHKDFRSRGDSRRRFCSRACTVAWFTCVLPLDDMVADHKAGLPVRAIIKKYGFSQRTIYRHLRLSGRKGFGGA
jgi:hypothetical protein